MWPWDKKIQRAVPMCIGLSSFQIDGVKNEIAIVGAGIVGSTAAYYLSKEKEVEVTVFDHGLGQATRQQQELLVPGFPSVVIRPGIAWLDWELIFTKS
ncbi:MAG: FAD-dependent oxidoreductase [Streptococcus sp.]